MYAESDSGPLCLFKRAAWVLRYGIVRYKADKYDRLWMVDPILGYGVSIFPTNDTIYPDPYTHIDPPSEVMNAAAEPHFSDSIELRWYPVNANDKFLIYLHFAETQILKGDPCAPQEFVWDGVRCSYNDTESPRIIYLNLSTSGLNGVIYPGLANLTRIHTLDLSNNNLTGTVPKFLANLNYLKVLRIWNGLPWAY
nr:leucine-rich repeat transmembrane protein kinase protein [Tanacetum cinerariifolium]